MSVTQNSESILNSEEIRNRLYEKLGPSGWATKLRSFIMSSDFTDILDELIKQSSEGQRFTPKVKYLLRAFEECPYETTKVVLIGQDPYPYIDVPDGLAFSCSLKHKEEKSLTYIFDEIEKTVYPDKEYVRDTDLKRWSKQGVLLLNSAFTVPIGKAGYHQKLWRPFMAFILDILTFHRPDLVYLFLGATAAKWKESIADSNYKIFAEHPAAAAYAKKSVWNSNDCFKKVNEVLEKKNVSPIIW